MTEQEGAYLPSDAEFNRKLTSTIENLPEELTPEEWEEITSMPVGDALDESWEALHETLDAEEEEAE